MRLTPLPQSYFRGDRKTEMLVVTLACLVVADGVITEFLVSRGFGFEANPFLQFWVQNNYFLILKLVGGVLAALLLWDIHKRHAATAFFTSVFLVISYTAIVFWNLFTLLLLHA
jgi:hypothetical protein